MKTLSLLIILFFGGTSFVSAQPRRITDVEIHFAAPVFPRELINLLGDVKPKELFYRQGTLTAGYQLKQDETVESALATMKIEHAKFLQRFHHSLVDATFAEDNEALEVSRNEFQKASTDFERNGLRISSIRLARSNSIGNVPSFVRGATVIKVPEANSERHMVASSYYREFWAPYSGTSEIKMDFSFQTFLLNDTTAFSTSNAYEHETHLYGHVDGTGYWSSNLPNPYLGTRLFEPPNSEWTNFEVGCLYGHLLQTYYRYFTYVSYYPGNNTSRSSRVKAQKLYRYGPSQWYTYAEETTGSFVSQVAPYSTTYYSY